MRHRALSEFLIMNKWFMTFWSLWFLYLELANMGADDCMSENASRGIMQAAPEPATSGTTEAFLLMLTQRL